MQKKTMKYNIVKDNQLRTRSVNKALSGENTAVEMDVSTKTWIDNEPTQMPLYQLFS